MSEAYRSLHRAFGLAGENPYPETIWPHLSSDPVWMTPEADVLNHDAFGVYAVNVHSFDANYKTLILEVRGTDLEACRDRWFWVADRLTKMNIRDTFWMGLSACQE